MPIFRYTQNVACLVVVAISFHRIGRMDKEFISSHFLHAASFGRKRAPPLRSLGKTSSIHVLDLFFFQSITHVWMYEIIYRFSQA